MSSQLSDNQTSIASHNNDLDLKDCIKTVLEEARLVLPGVQSLFGFQMIAVFNPFFHELSMSERTLHLFAIVLVVLSICALMTTTAYDRQTGTYNTSEKFAKMASRLVVASMVPLAIALSIEVGLVSMIATDSATWGICLGTFVLIVLTTAWFVFPQLSKER